MSNEKPSARICCCSGGFGSTQTDDRSSGGLSSPRLFSTLSSSAENIITFRWKCRDYFKKALIIHEGKTKEITAVSVVLYVIKNPVHLHKL